MCSIVSSLSKDKIKELIELNRYRGEHSCSITYYDYVENRIVSIRRSLGSLDINDIKIPENCYCICHQQAPTGKDNKDFASIHPAEYVGQLLWHNGILKPKTIYQLQNEFGHETSWDSSLLLKKLWYYDIPVDIDGSFSCIYWSNQKFYVFRNEIAPLFIDSEMNISSTKFDGGASLEPNIMHILDLQQKKVLNTQQTFNTMENPYAL